MLSEHPGAVGWRVSSWSKSENCVEVGKQSKQQYSSETPRIAADGCCLSPPRPGMTSSNQSKADNTSLR